MVAQTYKKATTAVALMLSLACPALADAPKEEPQVVFIAMDGTGSYRYLDRAKEVTIQLVEKLPPGSKVFVRWISADSYSDQASIVSAILPPIPVLPSALNRRANAAYRDSLARRKAFYDRLHQVIRQAQSLRAPKTDIWGALYAAAERFEGNPGKVHRLVLMTDMDDNVGRSYDDFSLAGAKAEIMAFQADPYQKGKSRKKQWTSHLTKLGAASVEFKSMDEVLVF